MTGDVESGALHDSFDMALYGLSTGISVTTWFLSQEPSSDFVYHRMWSICVSVLFLSI